MTDVVKSSVLETKWLFSDLLGNHFFGPFQVLYSTISLEPTKSILCIANRPASIVTPISGTTPDVLEFTLDIGGLPVDAPPLLLVWPVQGLTTPQSMYIKLWSEHTRSTAAT